jgi:alpha-tubulin suppressor-like RCC1 family protein
MRFHSAKEQIRSIPRSHLPLAAAVLAACFAIASCSDGTAPPDTPARLVFTVQPPASVVAGAPIVPEISVAIQDKNGNIVTTATDPITISFASNLVDGRLNGTKTRSALAGVAVFSGLYIDKAGAGYSFSASALNLPNAISTPLEVKTGEAQRLAFVVQPSVSVAGTALPVVSVAVQDAFGNTLSSADNRITLSLTGALPGVTIVGGSVSANAVNGVATFPAVQILKAGSAYHLLAESDRLAPAVSGIFTILPGQASKLSFTTQPYATIAGESMNRLMVEIQDAHGNRVENASNTVTISLGTNPPGAVLSGTTTVQAAGGTATFDDLKIDKAGAGYTLVAVTPALEPGMSAAFGIRESFRFMAVAAGYFHSCGIDVAGTAYCWGQNNTGQLGNSVNQESRLGVTVDGNLNFGKISAGRDHTCALTPDGIAYCWGSNSFGQLGTTTGQSNRPQAVRGNLVFAEVSTGYDHTCALTATGVAYCWGNGGNGELGNSTANSSPEPTAVSGGLTFASIGAGRLATCGATTDGHGYCWGVNASGQLGNGTTAESNQPKAVSAGVTFATVIAGGFHSCGLTTAGAAFCWGDNGSGQLGNGTNVNSTVPVAVSGNHVFVSLTVGNRHNCAIDASGDAYCWGDNSALALGTGVPESSSSIPRIVAGAHAFATISAGRFHTCSVTTDHEGYCWGSNGGGVLGTGTTTSSNVPVRVR